MVSSSFLRHYDETKTLLKSQHQICAIGADGEQKDYRPIHHALRRAHDEGLNVSVSILENCDPDLCSQREQFWLQQRRQEELAGGLLVLNSTKRRDSSKTAYLQVGIWFNEDTKHIHIASSEDGGIISTVCDDPSSKRGNPNLYGKLAKVLRSRGLPSPDITDKQS